MRCCHAWSGSASARAFNRGENVLRPLFAALGMLVAASAAAQSFTMKLAVPTVGDPNHEFIKRYKAAIEKNSGGRIKAELYPGGQLGQNQQMMEGVQLGSIELFSVPPDFARGADPRCQATDAAGTFTDI